MWDAATSVDFDEWFAALPEPAKEQVRTAVQVLRAMGPTLGRPQVDQLKGSRHANMKELRVAAGAMVIRVAFAFDPSRTAILLLGGDKHGVSQQRLYRELVRRADKLYEEHLAKRKDRLKGQ